MVGSPPLILKKETSDKTALRLSDEKSSESSLSSHGMEAGDAQQMVDFTKWDGAESLDREVLIIDNE